MYRDRELGVGHEREDGTMAGVQLSRTIDIVDLDLDYGVGRVRGCLCISRLVHDQHRCTTANRRGYLMVKKLGQERVGALLLLLLSNKKLREVVFSNLSVIFLLYGTLSGKKL